MKLMDRLFSMLGREHIHTSRNVFEELVKETLPDALDCFLIDDKGVHIVPGLVIEKFGQFSYTTEYGDKSNFYTFYVTDYCNTIIARRGEELSGLLLDIQNLLIKHKTV